MLGAVQQHNEGAVLFFSPHLLQDHLPGCAHLQRHTNHTHTVVLNLCQHELAVCKASFASPKRLTLYFSIAA